MVSVQLKYHWRDFENVAVADPLSGETLPWTAYMLALSGSFSAANTYLAEGDFDKAGEAMYGF